MKITKVNIPNIETIKYGLNHIKMEKLDSIVLIAGKNGSGKSRLLNIVKLFYESKPLESEILNVRRQITNTENNISNLEKTIVNLEKSHSATEPMQIKQKENELKNYKLGLNNQKQSLLNYQITIELDEYIKTSEPYNSRCKIVAYVPKKLNLKNCSELGKQLLINHAIMTDSVGVDNLHDGTLAKIQLIQDRNWNATHQHAKILPGEKEKAINDYEKLNKLIEIFLNTSLDRTIDGEATLFRFPLGKSELSDGQKILLQFCLAIYSQATALKDLILFMDEPENHLHPSALIEVFDRIQHSLTNGQIWIATHSIPLLAHFDPSLIWYMEEGNIGYAGRIPEKVLKGLLGNDDEIYKLSNFSSLPAQFAISQFAYECLFRPNAVAPVKNDPQTNQIKGIISESKSNKPIRILDYGAGKGRLASTFYESEDFKKGNLNDFLDYIAFDTDKKDKEFCENAIKSIYASSEKRYFNAPADLLTSFDKYSFDYLVMCNVFHEIDPKDWLSLFSDDGIILQLLKKDGILLIVEDHQIPAGEKAYQKGFLVLDTLQIKILFNIKENDTEFKVHDAREDGRLKAHSIPRNYVERVNAHTRLEAIKSLNSTAKDKIKDLRSLDSNYKNGRLHGFWVQQLANTNIALDELE